jgi:hypothetical protein
MPWNNKYMPDATLTAAIAAATAAANGFKNVAYLNAALTPLGSNVRAIVYRTNAGIDTAVYSGTYTGGITVSNSQIQLPTDWTQVSLAPADIDSGIWWLRLENVADTTKYLQGVVTNLTGAGPVRISKDFEAGDRLTWSSVSFASPSFDNVTSFELVVPNQSLTWSSNEAQRLIGRGLWYWDDLVNLNVQRTNGLDFIVSTRFRALKSGDAEQVQIWFQDGTGYAGGTGGTARFRIFPDNGSGKPNMGTTPLASLSYPIQNMVRQSNGSGVFVPRNSANLFPVLTLTPTTPLVAGQLYHMVLDNTAADPVSNFFCQDNAMVWTAAHNQPINSFLSDSEFGALRGSAPAGSTAYTWVDCTVDGVPGGNGGKSLPFMMLKIAGTWQGLMTVSSANPGNAVDSSPPNPNQWLRGNTDPVRERYTPTVNMTIVGFSFYANVSVAGTLQAHMKQGASVLGTATVTQSVANAATFPDPYSGTILQKPFLYHVKFPAAVSLTAGVQYDLEMVPLSTSKWRFWDMRNGKDWNVANQQPICPSYSEHKNVNTGFNWYGTNGYFESDNNGVNGNWLWLLHRA